MSLIFRHKFFFFIAFCFFFAVANLNVAYADSSLSVYVGYTGGPYYLKTKISESEIKALSDGNVFEYSTFDSGGFLVKGAGRGPEISSIFTRADINTANLKRFYFATSDGYVNDDGGEGTNAWYYSTLSETRYYYPKLAHYWDFQEKSLVSPEGVDIDKEINASAVETKSILAYESSFFRPKNEEEYVATPTLTKYEGLRLMMGQTSFKKGNAYYFAQSIKAMTCIFGKTPQIELEVNGQTGASFTADVGDTIKIKPKVDADDPLISKYAVYDIRWTISDPTVADFVRDADGNVVVNDDGTVSIVVYGKGNIDVCASYGDSPYSEYVTTTSVSGSGTGEGGGNGSGKGESTGDGEGEVEGSGTGNLDGQEATQVTFESKAEVTEGTQESSLGSGGGGSQAMTAAFKLNVSQTKQEEELNEAIQALMLDFNAFGVPIVFFIFACLTFGIVWRVKKTEADKDPFMNVDINVNNIGVNKR